MTPEPPLSISSLLLSLSDHRGDLFNGVRTSGRGVRVEVIGIGLPDFEVTFTPDNGKVILAITSTSPHIALGTHESMKDAIWAVRRLRDDWERMREILQPQPAPVEETEVVIYEPAPVQMASPTSIVVYYAETQLTKEHQPVKAGTLTLWVRTEIIPGMTDESAMFNAAVQPGEGVLNAVPYPGTTNRDDQTSDTIDRDLLPESSSSSSSGT